jgi:hypothetical protein
MTTNIASRSPAFKRASRLLGVAAFVVGVPAFAAGGTLTSNQRLYYPQGCLHNGTTAVCSFVFINQGQASTLNSNLGWGGSELIGIRFVDNGNVPHTPSAAYFMDSFGARQPQLVMQQGGQGTFVLEFPNVDPRVTAGAFYLSAQVVSGIAVTTPAPVNVGPPVSNPTPVLAGQPSLGTALAPQAQPVVIPQSVTVGLPVVGNATAGCLPQNAQAGLCNAVNRVNTGQAKVANAAEQASAAVTTVTQTANMVTQLKGALSSLWPGKSAPPAAPAQPAVVQPVALQQLPIQVPVQAQPMPVQAPAAPQPEAAR